MLGAGSKKMPTSKSLLLGHRWGTSPIEKRGRVNTLVTANAEWFSDEKLMLLFFAKILVMPWTNLSSRSPEHLMHFSLFLHSFLISLTVSLCGQEGVWYCRRREQGKANWTAELWTLRLPVAQQESLPSALRLIEVWPVQKWEEVESERTKADDLVGIIRRKRNFPCHCGLTFFYF